MEKELNCFAATMAILGNKKMPLTIACSETKEKKLAVLITVPLVNNA